MPRPANHNSNGNRDFQDVLVNDTRQAANQQKKQGRRTKVSRERFDAIYQASRRVDRQRVQQVQVELAGEMAPAAGVDRMAERIRLNRNSLSSMLFSFAVHLGLLLVLALLLTVSARPDRRLGLLVSFTASDQIQPDPGPEETPDVVTIESEQPPTETQLESIADDSARDFENQANNTVNEIASPILATPSSSQNADRVAETGEGSLLPHGGGLQGRDGQYRSKLAAARGGTVGSEAAVERGLRWIVQHQRADGSWRLRHIIQDCQGDCRNQGTVESPTAATGLALMALLGAGYTHQSGPYQNEVRDGVAFLLSEMRKDGNLTLNSGGKAGMYSQAIGTIALSESLALTQDPALAEPVDRAQNYICRSQNEFNHSWGYIPGQPGDITITGWQIAALKSCQLAGVKVDPIVRSNAYVYIQSAVDTSGLFGYKNPPDERRRKERNYNLPTTTAIGALNTMYSGVAFDSPLVERSAAYVFEQGVSPTDMYFNFYATQVFRHLGGPKWKAWNSTMRRHLLDTQDQSSTHARGSWYFPDRHGKTGGRLYTTAMAVMTLEVYYRYLPLYGEASLTEQERRQDPANELLLEFN